MGHDAMTRAYQLFTQSSIEPRGENQVWETVNSMGNVVFEPLVLNFSALGSLLQILHLLKGASTFLQRLQEGRPLEQHL